MILTAEERDEVISDTARKYYYCGAYSQQHVKTAAEEIGRLIAQLGEKKQKEVNEDGDT